MNKNIENFLKKYKSEKYLKKFITDKTTIEKLNCMETILKDNENFSNENKEFYFNLFFQDQFSDVFQTKLIIDYIESPSQRMFFKLFLNKPMFNQEQFIELLNYFYYQENNIPNYLYDNKNIELIFNPKLDIKKFKTIIRCLSNDLTFEQIKTLSTGKYTDKQMVQLMFNYINCLSPKLMSKSLNKDLSPSQIFFYRHLNFKKEHDIEKYEKILENPNSKELELEDFEIIYSLLKKEYFDFKEINQIIDILADGNQKYKTDNVFYLKRFGELFIGKEDLLKILKYDTPKKEYLYKALKLKLEDYSFIYDEDCNFTYIDMILFAYQWNFSEDEIRQLKKCPKKESKVFYEKFLNQLRLK